MVLNTKQDKTLTECVIINTTFFLKIMLYWYIWLLYMLYMTDIYDWYIWLTVYIYIYIYFFLYHYCIFFRYALKWNVHQTIRLVPKDVGMKTRIVTPLRDIHTHSHTHWRTQTHMHSHTRHTNTLTHLHAERLIVPQLVAYFFNSPTCNAPWVPMMKVL